MEASFILVTSWDFVLYRASKLCCDIGEVPIQRSRVGQRLGSLYGLLLVRHTSNAASGMPTGNEWGNAGLNYLI